MLWQAVAKCNEQMVHGDLKPSNVVTVPSYQNREGFEARLIDIELALPRDKVSKRCVAFSNREQASLTLNYHHSAVSEAHQRISRLDRLQNGFSNTRMRHCTRSRSSHRPTKRLLRKPFHCPHSPRVFLTQTSLPAYRFLNNNRRAEFDPSNMETDQWALGLMLFVHIPLLCQARQC